MKQAPDWDVEGADWPNRAFSRFVKAGGLNWHVQMAGEGPPILLLHGTGAATHSWRDLFPLLAKRHTVIAPDLPGHGFTGLESRHSQSLPRMARLVGELLTGLGLAPVAYIGHSAGAAIAVRLALDLPHSPDLIIGLNGAMMPFSGLNGFLFPAIAKLLFLNPFTESLLAARAANPGAVERIIAGTGSRLDAGGLDFYTRLLRCRRHVGAALAMMANWDLAPLLRDAAQMTPRLILLAAEGDRAVPPNVARRFASLAPKTIVRAIPRLGHLAHEEAPAELADLLLRAVAERERLQESVDGI